MANNLASEKKVLAVSLLAEGSSIRSIERVTGDESESSTTKRQTHKERSNIGIIISDQNRMVSGHCLFAGVWIGVLLCDLISYLLIKNCPLTVIMLAAITAIGMSHWQLSMAAKIIRKRRSL